MTSTIIPVPPAFPFNYAAFIVRYPEFANVSEPLCQAYYDEAGAYCVNGTSNPAFCDGMVPTLLDMLTAHIAWLNAPRDANGNPASSGAPASPIVGRISQASEGSVSVSTESNYPAGTPQWYQQTKYGSAFWAATAGYRTMRYSARPTFVPNGMYTGRRNLF